MENMSRRRRDGEDLIEYTKEMLIEHYENFPHHGSGCSCIDMLGADLRNALRVTPPGTYLFENPVPLRQAGTAMSVLLGRALSRYGSPL